MNDRSDDIVLIGGGLAVAHAAETLRDGGYGGRLSVITDEPHRPYERPPLSKEVLVGSEPPESVFVHDDAFYTQHDIDVITDDGVVDVDRGAGTVTTRSGKSLPFGRLLMATGARPRRLPIAGGDLDGVVTLRTLDDSRRLNGLLQAAERVVIVGAGWIGCEVAAAARTLGTAVTLVDPVSHPLERVLGARIGAYYADLHRRHGVDLRLGVGVTGLSGNGRVERVEISDGTAVDADLVVVGIGARPSTELAERAGLDVDNGIVVDASLVTDDPRIYAAGDVANAWHPRYGRRLRVEHWDNAIHQGKTVAANMLGRGEVYDRVPYFYSDQYDMGMEYVGRAVDVDGVVLRGDPDSGEFIVFWLSDGRLDAAMNVNIWDVSDDLRGLIGRSVDPARLADTSIPIPELAG